MEKMRKIRRKFTSEFKIKVAIEALKDKASVHYLYEYKGAMPKIKYELGDIPVIIILRKPVDRIISHVKYLNHHFGYSFEEELELEGKRMDEKYNSFWYYIIKV